jgi:hypothetical protein
MCSGLPLIGTDPGGVHRAFGDRDAGHARPLQYDFALGHDESKLMF